MNSENPVFAKLQNKNLDVDWYKFKSNKLMESFYSDERQGGSYFYSIQNMLEFLKLHKGMFTIMPNFIYYCEFTGCDLVTPHRDKGTNIALNLYLETDDATTIFYKEIKPDITHEYVKHIKPYSPALDNIVETCRFTAQPKDLYLLNVNEIHGIQKTTSVARTMITYRWSPKYSFSQILNSLNI
jgi:hypothetical protein